MYKRQIQEKFATSVIKEVGNAVYNVIGQYLDNGTLPFGEYEILGLSDGAVGIVEGDQLNGLLSDEGKAKLEEAKAGIIDGSIEVKDVYKRQVLGSGASKGLHIFERSVRKA